MKKNSLFYAFFVCLFMLAACKDDTISFPAGITDLSTQKIELGPRMETTIEFSVIPNNAVFDYDPNSNGCQIKMESINASGEYCRLTKVEPVQGKRGRYQATVKYMYQSENDVEQCMLVITNEDNTRVQSPPVEVYFSGTSLYTFSFLEDNNPGVVLKDIRVSIQGTDIRISTPFINHPQLKATFESNAEKILVNNVEQESSVTLNDFSSPVIYKAISRLGNETDYTITLEYSGLPVVIIDTPGHATVPSKYEDWMENASLTILNPDGTIDFSGKTSIRGRGNSTWNYPKKPYALKLDEKSEILAMPKHKRWVLLANWMDRTLLRNHIAFQIANSTGLPWNPRGEFVDVVLNGEHIGNYYLCEQIKVDKNRVNIEELDEGAIGGDEITGGYIMELDVNYDEINKFESDVCKLPYMFKDPDEVNEHQFAYMQNYINKLETSLYDDAELAAGKFMEYMDIDSYIDWWLVHELTGNGEPAHPKSTYMYKDKLGKLKAGPVWDFDWGTFTPGAGFLVKHTLYYPKLFENETFVARVKERWALLKPAFEKIPGFIESESKIILPSEKMNHRMWPITKTVNGDESMTFEEAVRRMKAAYEEKLQWLDRAIEQL